MQGNEGVSANENPEQELSSFPDFNGNDLYVSVHLDGTVARHANKCDSSRTSVSPKFSRYRSPWVIAE
ncbi:MAG: hypothetical protein K2X27_12365 [Candidatus Obscuribacterales bacterium]|nr:hypothetical protein [Candidatus Obscuribacterales bacterium]